MSKKCTSEERRGNGTWHVEAQDAKLDFEFGPQPVLSFTGWYQTVIVAEINLSTVVAYSILYH